MTDYGATRAVSWGICVVCFGVCLFASDLFAGLTGVALGIALLCTPKDVDA